VNARTDSDFETAFATLSQQRVGAVLVGDSALYPRRMEQLAALAARHALPAIYPFGEFAVAGGLMSYGSSIRYYRHQAGIYTGRMTARKAGGVKGDFLPLQFVALSHLERCIHLCGRHSSGNVLDLADIDQ
jgi:hypothetical protein